MYIVTQPAKERPVSTIQRDTTSTPTMSITASRRMEFSWKLLQCKDGEELITVQNARVYSIGLHATRPLQVGL